MQNKAIETDFFDSFAAQQDYNAFSDESNVRLVRACVHRGQFKPGEYVVDLGCGSGVFANLLRQEGFQAWGLDISLGLLSIGRQHHRSLCLIRGDVEALPFVDRGLDNVLLSGVIHHLPDPTRCAQEVFRVLKPGGRFAAFDPNRLNPFMWLYRDHDSPFYSSKGVTKNERPIIAFEVARIFSNAGFKVETHYLSGLQYRYIASKMLRIGLPIYNLLDSILFRPRLMEQFRAFVITSGVKDVH